MKLASSILSYRILEHTTSLYLVGSFKNEENLENNHLTITYFGKRTKNEKNEIINIIETNLKDTKQLNLKFTTEAMFGENKDVRVLLLDESLPDFIHNLREKLMPYNASKFKNNFNPHVTTNLKEYYGTLDRLVLCESEYNIIKEYKL
jgi:2'-5' RNA ligase